MLGAILFMALRTVFANFGALYLILLGLIAIAVMVESPDGLSGLSEAVSARLRAKRSNTPEESRDAALH